MRILNTMATKRGDESGRPAGPMKHSATGIAFVGYPEGEQTRRISGPGR